MAEGVFALPLRFPLSIFMDEIFEEREVPLVVVSLTGVLGIRKSGADSSVIEIVEDDAIPEKMREGGYSSKEVSGDELFIAGVNAPGEEGVGVIF